MSRENKVEIIFIANLTFKPLRGGAWTVEAFSTLGRIAGARKRDWLHVPLRSLEDVSQTVGRKWEGSHEEMEERTLVEEEEKVRDRDLITDGRVSAQPAGVTLPMNKGPK